jgi:hypothetical protein
MRSPLVIPLQIPPRSSCAEEVVPYRLRETRRDNLQISKRNAEVACRSKFFGKAGNNLEQAHDAANTYMTVVM